MMVSPRRQPATRRRQTAFTLAETAVAIVVMSVLLIAALNTIGMSRRSQRTTGDRAKGIQLAEELMSEILRCAYADPEDVSTEGGVKVQLLGLTVLQLPQTYSLGPDPGEANGTRSGFDDVDDFNAWSESPPAHRAGTVIPSLTGWSRTVSVIWSNPWLLGSILATDSGCKQITVTVKHNDVVVASLTSIKSVGLPTPNGDPVKILLVVANSTTLTSQEQGRKTLLESWGHEVTLFQANSTQTQYNTAVANVEIAYVSEEVTATDVSTKLRSVTIGVLNEDVPLVDDFGFSAATRATTDTRIRIDNNAHYITSPFTADWLTVFNSSQPSSPMTGPHGGGLQSLATALVNGTTMYPSLAVLEAGGALYGSGTAAGRRVQLPWGGDAFNFTELNADGRKILKRAILWAAGKEDGASGTPVCGDGTCNGTESPCNCLADCGLLALWEQPGATCQDGIDNDCDGNVDCADANCGADDACTICGDNLCQSGEDCQGCPADCAGQLNGSLLSRYCCGNGILELAEGLGAVCDGNP